MGKISLVLFALIMLILNGRAQDNIAKAKWNTEHIIVDGNDWEWPKPLSFHDDKAGLQYAIHNDYQKVYFLFKCDDERKIQKMVSAGWSVNLSSNDMTKRMNATIIFPGIKRKIAGQSIDANLLIKSYLSDIKVPLTMGFRSDQKSLVLNNWDQSDDRINIAIGVDSLQTAIYEIAIPFKELQAENSFQPNEQISLTVIINATNFSSLGGGQLGAQGGMGHGRSAGMPSGAKENNSSDRSGLFERVLFKQQFILSKK